MRLACGKILYKGLAMLVIGTIEFGTMTIHGNTTNIAVVHDVVKRFSDVELERRNKQILIEQNEQYDYIDTEEYAGQVIFSQKAYCNTSLPYGVNHAERTIVVSWNVAELQEHFESFLFEQEKPSDAVMWQLMQTEFHKTGGIDYESMKDRLWDWHNRPSNLTD